MALFKVSQGPSSNLNAQALTEGFCWFTPDDGKFYIDAYKNSVLTRIALNAAHADTATTATTAAGVSGIIPVEHGGTGASTAGGARTNLGLGSMATESASSYVKKSGDTMTGNLTTTGVTINNTNANVHLGFSRTGGHNSPNYINVPADGSLAISHGGAGGSNIVAMFDPNGLVPYTTNTKSVGTSDYKFASMYATNFYGTFKGNADTATNATTAANLANKPSLAASGNDITVTAGGKTSDTFTVPYASNAGKTNKTLTLANGRSFNGSADVTLLTNDLTPAIHKTYASTNYYATSSGSWEAATWYFMSVKPDSWYKPWTVRFKVHSFCPGYASYESYSDCMISGRSNSYVYHNWNERQDTAHYYTTIYPLTSTGFNNGYGHAIGISILYASNYTTAAYYRTFEVDYYDCENCTVEILDTPVKWANWPGTGSTNYGSLSNMDAVNRGLQESSDANTYNVLEMSNNYITNGAVLRMPGYSLFGFNRNNLAQAISNYNSGYTSTTTSINTARVYNTEGFDWTKGLFYMTSGSNFATGVNLSIQCRSAQSAFDFRYSDNCIAATSANTLGMVPYKAVYLRGVIKTDGLFYLAPMNVTYNSAIYKRTWTQDIPTAVETDGTYQYVYWFVGYPYYNSSYASSLYQLNLFQENKMYWFHNGRFEEYAQTSTTADKLSHTPNNTTTFLRGDNTWSNQLNGPLTLYRDTTSAANSPAQITFTVRDTDRSATNTGYIAYYNDHSTSYNGNLVINSAGGTFVGAGESASSIYSTLGPSSSTENLYLSADGSVYVYSYADTAANRRGFMVDTSGNVLPQKADAANNNAQNLGSSGNKWANVYATTFTGALSGNATTATTASKLSNTSKIGDTNKPVYFTASGVPAAISYTIDKSVPSNAVFTDVNVTQTATTTDANYELLFSGTADNTTRTEGACKGANLTYNPSTNKLTTGNIDLTGALTITGNAYLNNQTYAESVNANALTVTGPASFAQIPTAPTPAADTNDTSIATTAFVMNAFTANDAMVFKGVINANSALPTTHSQGWTYRIGTAGTYAGKTCEVGDIIICVTDGTAASNDHWAVIQNNIDGAVYRGSNAFTDANIIIADSTAGKVKSSGKTLTTTAPSSSSADTTIPTSKAVWSAISGASGYGKTGTVTSITLKAGSGISLDTDNTAITTSGTRTISHADTSSQASVTATDRTYIKSVTLDDYGHVTGLTTGTETVTNTDTKVTQSSTTTSSWRKVLLNGGSSNAYSGWNTAITSATDEVYQSQYIAVQPSTGTLAAKSFRVAGSANSSNTITSDATTNIYFNVNSKTPLVITDTAIRAGSSYAGTIDLGTSSNKWNKVYANYFYGDGSNLTNLPTTYWANLATTSAAAYNKAPEVASIKIGNGTTATATKGVTLQYNTTTEALDFIFI